MKLIRFLTASSPEACFGTAIQGHDVSFATLQGKAGITTPHLTDSRSYLAPSRKRKRRPGIARVGRAALC